MLGLIGKNGVNGHPVQTWVLKPELENVLEFIVWMMDKEMVCYQTAQKQQIAQ